MSSKDQTGATASAAHDNAGRPWPLADAAAFLRISKQTLRRGIDRGRVKAIRFGTKVMIPDATVRKLAAEGLK